MTTSQEDLFIVEFTAESDAGKVGSILGLRTGRAASKLKRATRVSPSTVPRFGLIFLSNWSVLISDPSDA